MTALDELGARLSGPAGPRRVAVLDLIRLAPGEPRAQALLIEHLARERDERCAILIIRHLGAARCRAAMPLLWRLYADRATPVRVAHAAVLAHDAIEVGGR